jgi:cell division protein FtsQ
MDRSFAGRHGIGRLTRRPAPAARRGARRPPSFRRSKRSLGRPLERLRGLLATPSGLLRDCCSFAWRRRRLRVLLLALLIASPLLAGGWLWLRQSSLVSVQRVHVSGAHGPEAHAIDAALRGAARHMSTLQVHIGPLRAAVAPYHVVRDLQVTPSFPHGLSIRVVEQAPVAALSAGGARTAVAADGVVLGPAMLSGSLPAISGASSPAKLIVRAYTGSKGLTLAMRSGLLAYFGDGSMPHAKWASLEQVLADPSSAGASYVDVRLPERPAAGFPAGVAPPAGSGTEASGSSSGQGGSESTEALAEGLSKAAGGGSSPGSSTSEPEATSEPESSSPPAAESSGGSEPETSESAPVEGG